MWHPLVQRSPGCLRFSLLLIVGLTKKAARWLVWAVRRSLYRLECRLICSLTEVMWRTLARCRSWSTKGHLQSYAAPVFGLFGLFMTFESEAMLHNWMQFVIKGTTIDLKSNTYCQVELARWRLAEKGVAIAMNI